jgi:hypothetical protein
MYIEMYTTSLQVWGPLFIGTGPDPTRIRYVSGTQKMDQISEFLRNLDRLHHDFCQSILQKASTILVWYKNYSVLCLVLSGVLMGIPQRYYIKVGVSSIFVIMAIMVTVDMQQNLL